MKALWLVEIIKENSNFAERRGRIREGCRDKMLLEILLIHVVILFGVYFMLLVVNIVRYKLGVAKETIRRGLWDKLAFNTTIKAGLIWGFILIVGYFTK